MTTGGYFSSFASAGWSLEILSLCQEFSKDGVVGMDLAGDDSCEKILDMNGHVQAFKVCWLYRFKFYCLPSMSLFCHLLPQQKGLRGVLFGRTLHCELF